MLTIPYLVKFCKGFWEISVMRCGIALPYPCCTHAILGGVEAVYGSQWAYLKKTRHKETKPLVPCRLFF